MEQQRKTRLGTMLLGTVIMVLMVQNYLLVRRNEENEKIVGALVDEVNLHSAMQIGDSLGAFTALTSDSTFVRVVPNLHKKRTLLFVFTTRCPTCRRIMETWNQLFADLAGSGVDIIGLSPDHVRSINLFQTDVFMSFRAFSLALDSTFFTKHKLRSVPQTVLVDTSGVVLGVWVGLLSDADRAEIQKVVNKSRSPPLSN